MVHKCVYSMLALLEAGIFHTFSNVSHMCETSKQFCLSLLDLPQKLEGEHRSARVVHGRQTSLSQLMHVCSKSWLWWVGWGHGWRW